MKKTLRFLSIIACSIVSLALSSQKASAQVTAITANVYDSSYNVCNTPADVYGYVTWFTTGTVQTGDMVTVYINYGDGSDTTYQVPTTSQASINLFHSYTITGAFQISVTLTNSNSVTTTVTGSTYVVSNTCSSLQGLVWLDSDGDCTYDSGEDHMAGHTMKITNTTTNSVSYAWVDNNGMYYAEVPDNYTYTIELAYVPNGLAPVCPVTGVATQAVSGLGTFINNFGYDCNTSSNTDFSVWGNANMFRPGFTRFFVIGAQTDNFCTSYPATVTLTLDPLLSYVSTTWGTPPSNVTGNVLSWNVTSLNQFNNLWSHMDVACSNSAVLGDTLCNLLVISYTGVTDPDHSNDTLNICRLVSNSYDPNVKYVAQGDGPLGKIANGTTLDYIVHFQNTGNDTAYNITVVDSIESDLNINTFQQLESSDPVSVSILPGNVVKFRFDNIYLPDSNVNEPLSHGWVTFKIKPNNALASGTTINNKVYIYFDNNAPIITNTTLNTIDIPTNVQNVTNGVISAKVYPNPANDELTITTESDNFTAQVMDILGRPVATSMTNSGKTIINTSTLANGMYILHIHADGKEMSTKINVQH
jgi:hypothetical protein